MRIKIEVTIPQLKAIVGMRDDLEGMLGSGETSEKIIQKNIDLVDKMLKYNKLFQSPLLNDKISSKPKIYYNCD